MKFLVLLFVLAAAVPALAQRPDRRIAVTIDDLPVVSTRRDIENRRSITRKLLGHITKAKVPAIGFVNENKLYEDGKPAGEQIALLEMWLEAGLELGNHTYSHRSLNRIELEDYKDDVVKGEEITRGLLAKHNARLRYFRHPFLQTGRSIEVKAEFAEFLRGRGYTIAPVTFDNGDYIFSRAYDIAFDRGDKKLMREAGDAYVKYMEAKLDYWERQSVELFGREVAQTMLLHANYINSDYFDDLARMMKKRGYRFVTLEEALKDEAYKLPDTYIGPAGISWLHRWALERGREFVVKDEPRVPEWVLKLSGFESE